MTIETSAQKVTVTARCGDRTTTFTVVETRGVYRVVEHGCGFSRPWPAVAYAAKLAVEGLR